MVEKSVKIRIWASTLKNLKNKKGKIEADLRFLGINKHVPITRLVHAMSLTPFIPADNGIKLKQLTSRKHPLWIKKEI